MKLVLPLNSRSSHHFRAPHNSFFPPRHLRRSELLTILHFTNKLKPKPKTSQQPNMYTPAAATVELDFLGVGTTTIMDQHHHNQQRGGGGDTFSTALPKSPFQKFLERGRSFRGIQAREVIPNLLSSEVLKSVIEARKSVAAAPENSPQKPKAKPMTIFYGGSVSVFDVTPDKFESIVKLAMEEKFKAAGAADQPLDPKQQQLVNVEDPLNEG
ncbi:protein TIFY 9 isoform X2 [Rosa chinensis]|uniref:protein TIFY 9 isoform X2 n=1 Tax=Rosa chinensis TaxID=74649 RepID=UPI000D08B4EF|nr:protein TIFY 9 isoform X2 [Rosa chinensis]